MCSDDRKTLYFRQNIHAYHLYYNSTVFYEKLKFYEGPGYFN